MKTCFLVFAAFIAGFAAVLAVRSAPASATPNGSRDAGETELRRVAIPQSFLTAVEASLAKARSAPADHRLVRQLQRDVDRWMLADPLGCIAFLHARGALGLVRPEQLPEVFAAAFRGNLALAVREAMHLPDARLRHGWLNAAFAEAAQTSPEHALELIPFLPTEKRPYIGETIVRNWAEKDPRAAWEAVVKLRPAPYKHRFEIREDEHHWVKTVMGAWLERDAAGFWAFLQGKLEAHEGGREELLLGRALGSVATGPHAEGLLRVLGASQRNSALEDLWGSALTNVARKNVDEALRIGLAEPSALARDRAAILIAEAVGPRDFDHAMQVLAPFEGRPAQHSAVQSILKETAKENALAAAARAEELENPLSRAESMKAVADAWYVYSHTKGFPTFTVDAAPPESGPSWLDVLAETLRARGYNGANWGREMEPALRDRLEAEMRSRLAPEEWARAEPFFRPYKREK